MLKELKEDVEKVYIPCVNKIEILIKENRKPKKKPKRNSWTESYKNWNEKFTRDSKRDLNH